MWSNVPILADRQRGESIHTLAVIPARTGSARFHGKVLAPVLGRPMLERMIEKAEEMLKKLRYGHVEITVNPEVGQILVTQNRQLLRSLEKKSKGKATVLSDTTLHPEEIRIKRIIDKRRRFWRS